MKRILFIFMLLSSPAWAALTLVGGCAATATSCTPTVIGGGAFAAGQFQYTFAFRTATTAPTKPAAFTALDTASASSSSFRSGCLVMTNSTPDSSTWTNATRVMTLIYSGTAATATANCVTAGVGFHTSSGTSGTTSTITVTGGTLTMADGSSTVIGAVGSSAAACLPVAFTSQETTTNGAIGDIEATSTYSTGTCTGSTGNWKSDTVEVLAAKCNNTAYGAFTCIQSCYGESFGASQTCVFPNNLTAGSTVVAAVGIVGTNTIGVTGCGVTWTLANTQVGGVSGARFVQGYQFPASGACTITGAATSATFTQVMAVEIGGTNVANDGHALSDLGTVGTGATATSPSITTASDGDFVIGTFNNLDANLDLLTPISGSLLARTNTTSGMLIQGQVQASHGAITTTATNGTSHDIGAGTLAFTASGGAPPAKNCTLTMLGAGAC